MFCLLQHQLAALMTKISPWQLFFSLATLECSETGVEKKKKGGEEKPYQNIRERKGKKPNLIPWSLLAENRHQDKRWGHPSSIVRSVCRLSLTYDLSLNTCCLSLKRTLLLQKVKKLPTEIIWSIQCSHLTSWIVLLVIIWRGSA